MKTHTLYAAGILASTIALSMPASAAVIGFDTNGSNAGGVIADVASFDWNPGTSYTIGGQASNLSNGDVLKTYVHGSLGSFLDSNGQVITNNFGLNTDYEVTFVAGFEETVFGISDFVNPVTGAFVQTINFVSNDSPFNFYEIWIDMTVDSDPLNGTGYNDGILISSGSVQAGGGGNITSDFVFSGDINDPISTNPDDYGLLDQFIVDDWAGTKSNRGIGGSEFSTESAFVNTDYILNGLAQFMFDLNFNSSQTVPFQETNPSRQYTDENGALVATAPGAINGITGDGVLLQVDGNSSFVVNEVPAPATLWLLGIGALTLVGASAARSKKS